MSPSSRHFNIDFKRICKWDSKYEMLKHPNYDKQEVKRKFTSGVPVFREELDDSLFEFLQSEQDAVPANILGGEALRIADN